MISEQEYFKFSKKLNKILKKCYVGTIYPGERVFEVVDSYHKQGLSPYYGHSSLTKQNCYFFNESIVVENRDAILELCAILPKMKTVKKGTAGTIAYFDILPNTQNTPETLKRYCEQADKFVALLGLAEIGLASDEFVGNDKFSATTIDLNPRYKSIVNPDAE